MTVTSSTAAGVKSFLSAKTQNIFLKGAFMKGKMQKQGYDTPRLELISFYAEDVIATSSPEWESDVNDSGWT